MRAFPYRLFDIFFLTPLRMPIRDRIEAGFANCISKMIKVTNS